MYVTSQVGPDVNQVSSDLFNTSSTPFQSESQSLGQAIAQRDELDLSARGSNWDTKGRSDASLESLLNVRSLISRIDQTWAG